MDAVRFVAIGDSFTEGMGDERADGSARGWADLVASGWAADRGEPISYANLAIRGKLMWQIVREQLEPALALRPTHLSFNGGGNDMLRPRTPVGLIAAAFAHVQERCAQEGVTLIALSGADPTGQLPIGPFRKLVRARGDELSRVVLSQLADNDDAVRALNWPDKTLAEPRFWSADRLHMNARGHHRVAARVLSSLGLASPDSWWDNPASDATMTATRQDYLREHLGPWVVRRLQRRSSGDGRLPKIPDWITVEPRLAA